MKNHVPFSALQDFFTTNTYIMCSIPPYWNYGTLLCIRVSEGVFTFRVQASLSHAHAVEDLQDFTAHSLLYLFYAFRCPHLATEYSIVIPVYEAVLTLIVLASFANASFRDPGIIPRGMAGTKLNFL